MPRETVLAGPEVDDAHSSVRKNSWKENGDQHSSCSGKKIRKQKQKKNNCCFQTLSFKWTQAYLHWIRILPYRVFVMALSRVKNFKNRTFHSKK